MLRTDGQTDGQTDGRTDGAGYIGPAEGNGGSKKRVFHLNGAKEQSCYHLNCVGSHILRRFLHTSLSSHCKNFILI